MKDSTEIARLLWQAAADSGHTANSTEWWLSIGEKTQALIDEALMDEAVTLVQTQLGGEEVSHEKLSAAGDDVGPHSAAHRVLCSRRAELTRPIKLERAFRPANYGYTLDNFRADYPTLDPTETLEQFFTHFISKGDTSKNWLEKFWHYAATGQKMKAERDNGKRETDSMGIPLDRDLRLRRRRAEMQHTQEQDSFFEKAFAEDETKADDQ